MLIQATVLLVFSVSFPCSLGVFDGRSGVNIRPGDQFPVVQDLLQCAGEDPDFNFTVGVGSNDKPGNVFRPDTSGFRFPASLNNLAAILLPVARVLNQLTIDNNVQAVSPPNFTEIRGLPLRYIQGSEDRRMLLEMCGSDVLAFLNESNRNADQPHYLDIISRLQNDLLVIWENLTTEEQTDIAQASMEPTPADYRSAWESEQRQFSTELLEVLSCRVAFRWADAGPTYIPRYFLGGFCAFRNCSLPDRDEFRCHADLSAEAVRYLQAARWDCCWTYSRQLGYRYQCGFRKVQFPIVCDCDCRCADKAGTK